MISWLRQKKGLAFRSNDLLFSILRLEFKDCQENAGLFTSFPRQVEDDSLTQDYGS